MKPIIIGATIALLSFPVVAQARPYHGHHNDHRGYKVHHPIEYQLQYGSHYNGYHHHKHKLRKFRHIWKEHYYTSNYYNSPVYYSEPVYYCPRRGGYYSSSTIRIGY